MMESIKKLENLIKQLRDPVNGCPWDKVQTHKSLKPYLIEESYELIDAIEQENTNQIKDELGDVLLQVMLHCQIASEAKEFTLDDVIQKLSNKLVERHPHVFAGKKANTTEEVKEIWEASKAKKRKSLLGDIPISSPALEQASKIGKAVAKVEFDWDTAEEVLEKVREEFREVEEAMSQKEGEDRIEEEIGDLLFSISQLARKLKLSPEIALVSACKKFKKRFEFLEKEIKAKGNLSKEELNIIWLKAKNN